MARTKKTKGRLTVTVKGKVPIERKISRLIVFLFDAEQNCGAHFSALSLNSIRFADDSQPDFCLIDKLTNESRSTSLVGKFKTGIMGCHIFARIQQGKSLFIIF